MTIMISTDLICDDCREWLYGPIGLRLRIKKTRKMARDAGWVHSKNANKKFIDLCPKCIKKRRSEPPKP